MPTLQDFLARIVPWPGANAPGVVNLHWRMKARDGKMIWSGRPFQTIENYTAMVEWAKKAPNITDMYHCMSLQAKAGRASGGHATATRSKDNALSLKALWLDIDVKAAPKGYPTVPEAVDALQSFIQSVGLPPPSILVGSGGGLHVYWVFDCTLSVEKWLPYAEGLQSSAQQFGLRFDPITTDYARILRVPTTKNYKFDPPKDVVILGWNDKDYSEKDLEVLTKVKPAVTAPVTSAPFDLTPFPKKPFPAGADKLGDDRDPIPWEPVFVECPFFRDAINTGGKDHPYGLWHLTVLATTFMEEGAVLVHKIGNKHPDYNRDTTKEMWDLKIRERKKRNLGWPNCASFEKEGSKFCAGCKHKGTIKTPLHLGLLPAPGFIPAKTIAPASGSQWQTMRLPKGYVIDAQTGYICRIVERPVAGGIPIPEYLPLFNCRITKPWAQKGPDALNFTATTDLNNVIPVSIPMASLATVADMNRCLLGLGVKVNLDNQELTRSFLMAFMTLLHEAEAAITSMPFGWVIDGGKREGFVYGGKRFLRDGTEHESGYGDPETRRQYTPTGELDPWLKACKVITEQKRPALECIVATAFAGPLMFSPAEYGGHVSAYGDSGVNKSTAMKVALAVWGHPKLAKESAEQTSKKSITKKMGELRNIPVYWDEIADEATQRKVLGTVFTSTEGAGGGFLFQDRSQRPKQDWQTCLITCSNKNFVDFIASEQKVHSAGVNRCFEFEVPPADEHGPGRLMFYEASRIMQELENNYGMMGLRYAKLLGSDPQLIDKFTHDCMEIFQRKVNAREPERFWAAVCSTMIAGARLANTIGAEFNVGMIENFLINSFFNMRHRLTELNLNSGSSSNAQDVLTQFFKEYSDETLYTDVIHDGRGKPRKVAIIHGPRIDIGKPVQVQCGVSDGEIRISSAALRDYLNSRKMPPEQIMRGIRKHFPSESSKATLGSGTPYNKGQEQTLTLKVKPGSPFEAMLHAHTPYEKLPIHLKETFAPAPVTATVTT